MGGAGIILRATFIPLLIPVTRADTTIEVIIRDFLSGLVLAAVTTVAAAFMGATMVATEATTAADLDIAVDECG